MDAKEPKPPDAARAGTANAPTTTSNTDRTNHRNADVADHDSERRSRTMSDSSSQPPPMPPRPTGDLDRRSIDSSQRPSAASLRAAFRSSSANGGSGQRSGYSSVRVVTPDNDSSAAGGSDRPRNTSRDRPHAHDASPRAVPGGPTRRQGVVFNDPVGDNGESTNKSAGSGSNSGAGAGGGHRIASSGSFRPRTRTMDTAMLGAQRSATASHDHRHRVGSVSSPSPATTAVADAVSNDSRHAPGPESVGFPSIISGASAATAVATSAAARNDRKSSGRRLVKRHSSRPTSPQPAMPPLVDSLPLLIPTENPRKVSLLMRVLCGKMRGEIEYQGAQGGPWHSGVAYIDDERACLMFDSGQNGPFHIPLVADLRGCRILPVDYRDADKRCIELVSSNPVVEFLMYPLVSDEFDLWLAALLCWQQLRPVAIKMDSKSGTASSSTGASSGTGSGGSSPSLPMRPEVTRRGVPEDGPKSSNIIKVGKLKVWDKGPASNPRALVRRSSTRDHRSPQMSWRRISCILHDNGDFKIMAENDVTILAVLGLGHLSRFAIQQLDRTVLDEEHCIAIFPMYSAASTHVSVYRPIFLALDNRTHFEVWFALLRAFALPDMYKIKAPSAPRPEGQESGEQGSSDDDREQPTETMRDVDDVETSQKGGEVFRVEKTIMVRVTEAKIRNRPTGMEAPAPASSEKNSKSAASSSDPESVVGNYLAEVVLDGEVRARTTVRPATKNPFWREDCEFVDLPRTMPELSVVLKQVDGPGYDAASSSASSRSQHAQHHQRLSEVVWGSVELPLAQTRGGVREMEDWMQVLDDSGEPIGSMLVKVVHEDHIVLLEKEYRELGELLHNFNSGLTTLVAAALPTHLRRLAELFLNIFQVSGSASEWIMALVEEEIDGMGSHSTMKKLRFDSRLKSNESTESSVGDRGVLLRDMGKSLAGEANLLFRGNTLLTQAFELHMRRLGRDFLLETLQDKLFEINEANPDCEVDPSKLPQSQSGQSGHQHGHGSGHGHHHIHGSGGHSSSSGGDGGVLEQHWTRLIEVTTEVWDCIAASAARMNSELRGILKYIRAVAEDRYGDFLRSVSYTSVSGFLFLRFICPAILSPKLFGLLRDHPQPRAQRTFTLIAKALQKLSNLSTFGKREEWMEPMNRFLNVQRPRFREYIDQVCDVTPSEREARTFHASYRTPMTILSRLGATAREGFPSLPFLVDQARNYAGLVKLWSDVGAATALPQPKTQSGTKSHTQSQSSQSGSQSDSEATVASTTASTAPTAKSTPSAGTGANKVPMEGDMLRFHEMCASLQARAEACLATNERARLSEARRGASDPDELADILDQASLVESLSYAYGGSSMWSDSSADHRYSSSESPRLQGTVTTTIVGGAAAKGAGKNGGMGTYYGSVGSGAGKMSRAILNGIMRRGNEFKDRDKDKEKDKDKK